MEGHGALGVNGAFEPLDLATLRWDQIDLESGWFVGQRMKKRRGARRHPMRRFQMWPETIEALKTWQAKSPGDIVFPKECGSIYKTRQSNDSAFSGDFNALQDAAGVRVRGRGFYGLRHSCAHFMGKAPFKDQMGVDVVLGHTYSLDHTYDPCTDDRHVAYVCEYARHYLFEGREAADRFAAEALTSVGRVASTAAGGGPRPPAKAG